MAVITAAFLISILSYTHASSLAQPPQSAVIVAFEDTYDLSLLANTISDIGLDTTLVISYDAPDYYEHLISVELIKLNVTFHGNEDANIRAVKLCKELVTSSYIQSYIQKLQPTFIIFPAVRHDACLLKWTDFIKSIPILWARGQDEELYVFTQTGMALPVHEHGFIQNFVENLNFKYFLYSNENNYISSVENALSRDFQSKPLIDLYSTVQLVLWGADPILRVNFALLTQLVAEIGCHHCRGPNPLPKGLQKDVVDYKSGTVIILLEPGHESVINEISNKTPDLAIIWKTKSPKTIQNKAKNLFIHNNVDRQDLIGYPRARVVLCHCTDSEFLESAYHGSPMICFPRNRDERFNARRAADLGFAKMVGRESTEDSLSENIKEIHTTTQFRENARVVSQALRDRSVHAMDRIQYWLGYTARHMGEGNNLLVPKKVSTYAETLQTITGFIIGVIFTSLATIVYMGSQFTQPQNQKKRDSSKKPRRP